VSSVRAVKTLLGIVRGRDALILEQVLVSMTPRSLRLRGTVDLALCSGTRPSTKDCEADAEVAFEIDCTDVLAFKFEELDFTDGSPFADSSIVEVTGSPWLDHMASLDSSDKVSKEHRHYEVQTYDDVVSVVCRSLTFRTYEGDSEAETPKR